MSNKANILFSLTNEFHDDIDNLYESSVDNENSKSFEIIEELIKKLKAFKKNLIKREEI